MSFSKKDMQSAPLTPGDLKVLYENKVTPASDPIPTSDSDRDKDKHSFDPNSKKNFDQKIFIFPESYNALRRELVENWPALWALVSWRMAFKAEEFVEYMNDALDLPLVFDTEKIDFICTTYLTALRKKRGLSK